MKRNFIDKIGIYGIMFIFVVFGLLIFALFWVLLTEVKSDTRVINNLTENECKMLNGDYKQPYTSYSYVTRNSHPSECIIIGE